MHPEAATVGSIRPRGEGEGEEEGAVSRPGESYGYQRDLPTGVRHSVEKHGVKGAGGINTLSSLSFHFLSY